MTLDIVIMLIGAFVTVLPFLGFPSSWDTVFLVIAGVSLVVLGIVVRRRAPKEEEQHQAFLESTLQAGHESR